MTITEKLDEIMEVIETRMSRIEHRIQFLQTIESRLLSAKASLSTLTLKSVNEIIREYQDTLERYVVDAVNGHLSSGEMNRTHKALLKRLAPEAYKEGMREGGVKDPEAEMEDDDDSRIDNWIIEQSQYTLDFAKACFDASNSSGDDKTNKRDALLDRVEEWAGSLRNLGQFGYLSAKGNLPLTFEGDDGVDSCNECQKYNGQTHRMSWWDKRGLLDRPNGNFTCGRYPDHCKHHFVDGDGIVIVD